MAAYDPEAWTDLFVATAGASAALAGLVFVAVSINIERILQYEGLPGRALQTVLLLTSILVTSIVGLIPGQSTEALGAELLACSLVFTILIVRQGVARSTGGDEPASWRVARGLMIAAATAPFLVGGLSLLAESGGGLYWTVAGIVFAAFGGIANAWVLLVEILR